MVQEADRRVGPSRSAAPVDTDAVPVLGMRPALRPYHARRRCRDRRPSRDAAACLPRPDLAAAAAGVAVPAPAAARGARRTGEVGRTPWARASAPPARAAACGSTPRASARQPHAAADERLLETSARARNPGDDRHRHLGAGSWKTGCRGGRATNSSRSICPAGCGRFLDHWRPIWRCGSNPGLWPIRCSSSRLAALLDDARSTAGLRHTGVQALAALAGLIGPSARRLRAVPDAGCRAGGASAQLRRAPRSLRSAT